MAQPGRCYAAVVSFREGTTYFNHKVQKTLKISKFAEALWKYVRLLVNCIAGVQQSDLDKEFQVNPHKDGEA